MRVITMRLLRKLTLTGAVFIGLVLVSDVLFAEDSTERGLIEQFGDQLKKLFGGEGAPRQGEQKPNAENGLSDLMEDLVRKAQELWNDEGLQTPRNGGLELDMNDPRMADLMKFYQAQLEKKRPSRNEKDHKSVFSEYKPVIAEVIDSTASIINKKGDQVALGTVIDPSGLLVTKASELPKKGAQCLFTDGRKSAFTLINTDERWDIALIKVNIDGLKAVNFDDSNSVELGSFLAASGTLDYPIAVGVASVAPRNLSINDRGFLGVGMENTPDGVKVTMVQNGSGADKAGIRDGDVILKIDGKEINSPSELAKSVSGLKPSDEIEILYLRNNKKKTVTAVLGSRSNVQPQLSMPDPGAQFGGPLSNKRVDFPNALQHDLTIRPDECGGPIVNLDGKVVGVNIARGGRVKSYAIPSLDLIKVINSLKSKSSGNASSLKSEIEDLNKKINLIEKQLLELQDLKKIKQRELESSSSE